MKIVRVEARLLRVPIEVPRLNRTAARPVVLVEVESDTGLRGHGVTSPELASAVRTFIADEAGPRLLGQDPRRSEQIWYDLFWTFNSRSLTGVWSGAVSALDIALWDLKGKACGEPIWRLLGGTRSQVQCYATFGLSGYDREQLVDAARDWVARGYDVLKMIVAAASHRDRGRRSTPADLREDAARLRSVREAVGDEVEIGIDANCLLSYPEASMLSELCAPYGVSWFEEPLLGNDPNLLRDLRRAHATTLSAGQNEGSRVKFREFLSRHAVDLPQPNVANVGGFTEALKVAGLADAHHARIGHGGGWGFHNMHLQAGPSNGTRIEIHQFDADEIFEGLPAVREGTLTLPEAPGLGFEPRTDAVREYTVVS